MILFHRTLLIMCCVIASILGALGAGQREAVQMQQVINLTIDQPLAVLNNLDVKGLDV